MPNQSKSSSKKSDAGEKATPKIRPKPPATKPSSGGQVLTEGRK